LHPLRGAPCNSPARARRARPQDGTLVTVQGDAPPAVQLPPTEEDLQAAADAVTAQAALVRSLKEERGLTNQVRAGQGGGPN
jgi:hypothetical protein